MARSKQQEPKTIKVRYSREGELGQFIGGQHFLVPETIPIAKRGAWIESKWREQQAREQAEAEKEQREAAVLRDRQAEVRKQEAEALLLAREVDGELSVLKRELADIQSTVAAPDQQKIAEASQTAAALMGRVVDCSRDVNALAEKVEALHQQTAVMLEQAASEREVTLKLLQNQQELINGGNKHHGDLINQYADRYVEAAKEATKLSEQIGLNWEVVDNAARINETAITQATAASKKLLQKQHEEFLASLNVALGAMGVTQEDLERELVRLDTMGADFKSPLVSPEYLAQMVMVTRKHRDARADADRRTNEASASSAGRLNYGFVPRDPAKTKRGFK